jgi:hypothetical protein
MRTTSFTEPDLSTLTARQRRAGAAGDYSMVASRTRVMSGLPHDDADLRARWYGRARDPGGSARC